MPNTAEQPPTTNDDPPKIPQAPRGAKTGLVAICLVAFCAFALQLIVTFSPHVLETTSPAQQATQSSAQRGGHAAEVNNRRSTQQPRGATETIPRKDHEALEHLFWIFTNFALLAPAFITAILAWLTYSLISYTLTGLRHSATQSKASTSSASAAWKQYDEQKKTREDAEALSILQNAPVVELLEKDIIVETAEIGTFDEFDGPNDPMNDKKDDSGFSIRVHSRPSHSKRLLPVYASDNTWWSSFNEVRAQYGGDKWYGSTEIELTLPLKNTGGGPAVNVEVRYSMLCGASHTFELAPGGPTVWGLIAFEQPPLADSTRLWSLSAQKTVRRYLGPGDILPLTARIRLFRRIGTVVNEAIPVSIDDAYNDPVIAQFLRCPVVQLDIAYRALTTAPEPILVRTTYRILIAENWPEKGRLPELSANLDTTTFQHPILGMNLQSITATNVSYSSSKQDATQLKSLLGLDFEDRFRDDVYQVLASHPSPTEIFYSKLATTDATITAVLDEGSNRIIADELNPGPSNSDEEEYLEKEELKYRANIKELLNWDAPIGGASASDADEETSWECGDLSSAAFIKTCAANRLDRRKFMVALCALAFHRRNNLTQTMHLDVKSTMLKNMPLGQFIEKYDLYVHGIEFEL